VPSADKQQGNSKKIVGRPFKKGQSGNPNGRPKKEVCIPDILRSILHEEIGEDEKITRLEAILKKVVKMAYEGDHWAIGYLSDRTEGRALDRIEATINQEPITVLKIATGNHATGSDATDDK